MFAVWGGAFQSSGFLHKGNYLVAFIQTVRIRRTGRVNDELGFFDMIAIRFFLKDQDIAGPDRLLGFDQ